MSKEKKEGRFSLWGNLKTASILLGSVQEDKITTNFNTFFNKNSINIL